MFKEAPTSGSSSPTLSLFRNYIKKSPWDTDKRLKGHCQSCENKTSILWKALYSIAVMLQGESSYRKKLRQVFKLPLLQKPISVK